MQLLAPLQQHRVVSDFPCESVLEGVFDFARRGLFVNELGELKIIKYLIDLIATLLDDLASERKRELFADYGQRLQ